MFRSLRIKIKPINKRTIFVKRVVTLKFLGSRNLFTRLLDLHFSILIYIYIYYTHTLPE